MSDPSCARRVKSTGPRRRVLRVLRRFPAAGGELFFSILDERLEGSVWAAYPQSDLGEPVLVGGPAGGSL